MYYLLGYRIVKGCETYLLDDLESKDERKVQTWDERLKKATGITGKSVIFQSFNEEVLFRVCILIFLPLSRFIMINLLD